MTKGQPLDLHQLALRGRILIEASAGTGKTYSLAALYVRLVLGLGDTAFDQGLKPEQILVLTFTRAATQELRHRIRERLQNTADILAGLSKPDSNDDFILQLLEQIPQDSKEKLIKRCQIAANSMDMAAIYTIHGFCQRALKRFAFASGQNFEQDLETDTQTLAKNAREDYWRRFLQNQSPTLVAALMQNGIANIHNLMQLMKTQGIKAEENASQTALPASFLNYEQSYAELQLLEEQANTCFKEEKTYLMDWFADQADNLNGSKINKTFLASIAEAQQIDDLKDSYQNLLTESVLGSEECWKKNKQQSLANLKFFSAMQAYLLNKKDCVFPLEDLLQHAANWIAAEQRRQLEQSASITFDTMVDSLAKAVQGENGKSLCHQLFNAYPCTLIDEFQDTDEKQYSIFKSIYAGQEERDFAWLMIGDPKQAIYSFRGADIETYIQAKNETAVRKTLETNYRSSPLVIQACNQLFSSSPLEEVFNREEIPFQIVKFPEPNSADKQLFLHQQPLEYGIELTYPSEDSFSGTAARDYLATVFAKKVALLLQGANKKLHYVSRGTLQTTIQPSDICLLVRSGIEAQLLKKALKKYEIEAVFLSEKNSVYQEDEAKDLAIILRAVLAANDSRLLRAALACPSLNFSWQEQYAFQQDDLQWQSLLNIFKELRSIWQHNGPLPMLYCLLDKLKITQKQKSERVYTNLFHLVELLQQQVKTLNSIEAQLNYLETAIYEEKQGDDDNSELLIRLENERNLVKIMTLHKSKGLEFPIVFIPFASISLSEERLLDIDEEMRLLYVGITRAKYFCSIGLLQNKYGTSKDNNQFHRSALGRLLFGLDNQQPMLNESISERLKQLEQSHVIRINSEEEEFLGFGDNEQKTFDPINQSQLLKANQSVAYWGVSSYSALSKRSLKQEIQLSEERSVDDENEPSTALIRELNSKESEDIHQFPKGRLTGNLLHDLLENCCHHGFDYAYQNETFVENLIAKMCQGEIWQDHKNTLQAWLEKLLNTPLVIDQKNIALNQLKRQQTLAETEFWLRTPQLDLTQLNSLAAQFVGEKSSFELAAKQINGMLKGFIDLVFCVDEKYYVLDYKTNYLGSNNAAYSEQAMRHAMLENRYDLQGSIYQQALHYLLATRLPDYSPDKHLGGCYFFFLRGIESESRGLLHLAVNTEVLQAMEKLFPRGIHHG